MLSWYLDISLVISEISLSKIKSNSSINFSWEFNLNLSLVASSVVSVVYSIVFKSLLRYLKYIFILSISKSDPVLATVSALITTNLDMVGIKNFLTLTISLEDNSWFGILKPLKVTSESKYPSDINSFNRSVNFFKLNPSGYLFFILSWILFISGYFFGSSSVFSSFFNKSIGAGIIISDGFKSLE